MKYSSHLLVKTYIITLTATWGSCWQFFTSLSEITLTNSPAEGITPDSNYLNKVAESSFASSLDAKDGGLVVVAQSGREFIHSEYFFGHCQTKAKMFYTHAHIEHMDALGKVIVRGWIDVFRIPTCILLRAMSFEVDLMRSSAFQFQLCVPRITYCHTQHRFKYYYYELYVPDDMIGGMDWDLYFFGPPSKEW